jgi:enoyl-CoA hydratase/carnithine racemase
VSNELTVSRDGAVLAVTFNRPERHNAMTYEMYDGLYAACETADGDDGVKALVLRGAGGRAFVSGTDIASFRSFSSGDDGLEYERRIERVVNRLEEVRVPTIAAIAGYCVGGGLAIAAVCDLRIATRSSRFGMPIARTLGNCLSMNSASILVAHLGPARTLDLVLRARMLNADAAHAAGFVAELCADDALDRTLASVLTTLQGHAPLTMWAAKVAVARLRRANLPSSDDLVTRVYGSSDFRHAVEAFGSEGRGKSPQWTGE